MKKHTLAQEAIEAAIEANDYRIVLPIQFDVTHVAIKKTSASPGPPSVESGEKINSPAKKADTAESFLEHVGEELSKRTKGGGAHPKSRQ
jgi:ABC-type microcin C transport system permease subunit YejE